MDFNNLPSILTPDLGLLFWMMLAFLVVFGVLAKFGFPAITNMVEERKAYIDESLRKAHEANEKLQNIQLEGEQILLEARERQAQILKDAAATRDALVSQAQEKAREEGKPEAILERIAMGRLNKYFQENVLLEQAFEQDNKLTVEQYCKSNNATPTAFKRVNLNQD